MVDLRQLLKASNLVRILTIPAARAERWAEPLAQACAHYSIGTGNHAELQLAAFIAQVGHESGRLRYVKEIWGPMDWQLRYEGRKDLGNTEAGDGKRFMGRGLIQITGRYNYASCGSALGLDLINHPKLLEQPDHAAMSAAWYWHSRRLNDLADVGNFRRITKKINGGYNGIEDRTAIYNTALDVFGIALASASSDSGDVQEHDGALS